MNAILNMIPLSGASVIAMTPEFFKQDEKLKDKPTFFVRVPTFQMRDKMAAILFQRGLIPTTMSQSRGILIDALYELYDEPTADDHASFLESYWTRAEVHEELVGAWQIREAQRLFDIGMGVKKDLPAEPIPPAPFTMREQARQARIVTEVLNTHEAYRAYQARFMVQQQEEDAMLVRLFLDRWENCGEVRSERDALDRLTEECIEELRGWLQEQGATSAWDEITGAVKSQFGASGRLEKNFDSPLGSNSSQTGSQTSSGDLATNDGNLTTSSTTPIPSGRSPATTGSSRNSRSGKKGKSTTGRTRSGRTAARS